MQVEAVAVSYVRQSSAKTDKSEASPLTQRAANESEAVTRSARFLRHFEDIGVSGWDADAYREGFEEMLKSARAGAFNMLIVYDVSRFSRREVMDAIPIVSELHRLGITIVSLMDGVFAPRDTMALIYLIMRLDAVNKESEHKSQKVRAVKAAQRAEGSWLGGQTPYGFDAEQYLKGKLSLMRLVHNKAESANLRRLVAVIFKYMSVPVTRKAGQRNPGTLSAICDDMTTRKIPTRGQRKGKERKSSAWGVKTLKWILLNPAIAGMRADPIYKVRESGVKTSTLIGYRIHRDEDGRPVMICEPIIPPEKWFLLRDWIFGRGQGEGVAHGTSLLSGLRNSERKPVLKCECGRPGKAQNSGAKPVYLCTRGTTVPTVRGEHDMKNSVMQSHLDAYVAGRIFAVIQKATADDVDADTLAIVDEATRVFSRSIERPETAAERTQVVTERADANNALADLYDDLDAGLYSGPMGRDRFKTKKARIDNRISAADTRLEELADPETVRLPLAMWLDGADNGDPLGKGSWWATTELADRRKFVELFVSRVTVKAVANAHRGRIRGGYDVTPRIDVEFVRFENEDDADTEV
ncbi:recombinase family protein [Streptomyces antarcticus]|uniref:recombinase family protein n=1 Tax=Streptomyces antarcticus TaxID=2996458 RepID=UPI00226E280A|nr:MULTISPECIES: recombinase family protein [unclassified Streptomyces]MCY0943498.1 recombinase family protein [Streptomyces sp. H34-AA3]MCZ4083593.1 recombinase family protein [Streptomyces sp. H34-S5]